MTNNERQNVVFPINVVEIISQILKKYGLEISPEEIVTKVAAAKTTEEKKEVIENLPGRKIARIIREAAESKMSTASLASELKKQFDLANGAAKNLAKELKDNLLEKVVQTEEEASQPPEPPPKSEKPDTYREPVE